MSEIEASPARRSSRGRLVGAALVLLAGLRALYLFIQHVRGDPAVQPFHVESAVTLFACAGVVLRGVGRRVDGDERTSQITVPLWAWAAFVVAALMLYLPAIGVGFLSDDYVLIARAADWHIGAVTPGLFRPLPLLLWAALVHLGASAATFHAVNVVLHGTNVYLTSRVVERWLPSSPFRREWSVLAGGAMLVAPIAPEAVVWCSGVFDVTLVTATLAALLCARDYDGDPAPPPMRRVRFVAVALAAFLCKETGAVAGVLVLIDAGLRHAKVRRLAIDTGIVLALASAVSALRLLFLFGPSPIPFSKYLLQRTVFGSLGNLAAPWHVEVIQAMPWIPIATACLVAGLFTAYVMRRGSLRLLIGTTLWTLVSVLPVAPVLGVGADLQGSRYLYLPMVAWCGLLAGLAADARTISARVVAASALACILVLEAVALRRHLDPWLEAADLRDRVTQVMSSDRVLACDAIAISHLPDSVRGAFVLRNGAPEMFARDYKVRFVETAEPGCTFRWDADKQEVTGSLH